MATPYSEIYNSFIARVTDYDLLELEYEERDDFLHTLMVRSCSKFSDICLINLNNRDDESEQFNDTLPDDVVDIVSTGMIVEWLKPRLYHNENLRNMLNTKDYSTFSPANLLSQIKEAYTDARKEFNSMMVQYSYTHGNVAGLRNG